MIRITISSSLARLVALWHRQWSKHHQRRWPCHWMAILDDGRRRQDRWTPRDWKVWGQALNDVQDLNLPLPAQAPAIGWGCGSRRDQRRYMALSLAGYTPLVLALRLGDPAPFKALLDAGANPCSPGTPSGKNPIELLETLDQAYRTRRWTVTIDGASPQPWHAMLRHRLAVSTASNANGPR